MAEQLYRRKIIMIIEYHISLKLPILGEKQTSVFNVMVVFHVTHI